MLDYAFINDNNTVINICVFDEHNEETLEIIKNHLSAKEYISCNEFGVAQIGGTWNGEFFVDINGERIPPTERPADDDFFYKYDWELGQWLPFTENRMKNFL